MQIKTIGFFMKSLMYLFSILSLLLSSNWIMFFISLELNMVMFCWIMKKTFLKYKLTFFMKYFLFQSMNSISLLLSLVSQCFFNMEIFILLSFFSKMGLPPLFFWLKELIKYLSFLSLMFILVFQKIPLLVLFSQFFLFQSSVSFVYFLVIMLIMISIGMFSQPLFNVFFFYSSLFHSYVLLFLSYMESSLFFIYLSVYSVLLSGFYLLHTFYKNLFFYGSWVYLNNFLVLFLFLNVGLPPSPFFYLKFLIMMKMMSFGIIFSMGFVLSVVLNMYTYFRFFMAQFFMKFMGKINYYCFLLLMIFLIFL